MPFKFTRQHLKGREQIFQRFFEILPGLTSWTILISATGLSFSHPACAAIFIIAFLFYWLLRLLYMTLFLVLSYSRLMMERQTDWMALIAGIDHIDQQNVNSRHSERSEESLLAGILRTLFSLNFFRRNKYVPASSIKFLGKLVRRSAPQNDGKRNIPQRIVSYIHRKELRNLQKEKNRPPPSMEIYHLVIFPIVKEPRDIVEPGVKSLSRQQFSPKRILVIFALEDRAEEKIKEAAFAIAKEYQHHFLDILTIVHPSGLPGEAAVKGANVTYAARQAAPYFHSRNIPLENIILSCFDADTIVGEEYFSCLTYHFMIASRRIQSSFQPIPVYHNNIWQVPSFARVIEIGSSFFQLIEATNPEKLVTFSSHSMSFKALVDVGYWPVDMISDDSAIFWKSYIHFDGQYQVIPMYVTLSMDVAASDSLWPTIKSIYKQKRRWAWGVENFPIVMRAFLQSPKISLYNKIRHAWKLFEGHISWATWGFILTIISWLPVFLSEYEFTSSVVYYNAPKITKTIFHLASSSLFISVLLSMGLLPPRKSKDRLREKIGHVLEWLMIPFILVFFSSLPALDAQTRLMINKRMEFWVTEKKRKK